jgi:hypothetical protein
MLHPAGGRGGDAVIQPAPGGRWVHVFGGPDMASRVGFHGLTPWDVDLHRDLIRCPGCNEWAAVLSATRGDRRPRCNACLAARDPVVMTGLKLFGGPLERVTP